MKKHIPNFITSLNLLCGCIALFFAFSNEMVTAAVFVFLGIFFDFFDGFFARLLKVESKVGLEFDSLADVVTSGVVPGVVMMQLLSLSLFGVPYSIELFKSSEWQSGIELYVPFVGLFIAIAAAYRLAKFNVDTRQTDQFIGMPTPAISIWTLSLPLILIYQYSPFLESLFLNSYFLLGFTLLVSVLMNVELRLFALKFKSWSWADNKIRYSFLIISAISIVLWKFIAISIILTLYILLSVLSDRRKGINV
ncbi:MAG TPA: CDP-alcohol phosphatidyltransferase family protein [Flavobacteriaceae bacterium]|nr:CDP-alcohol phosphatidyltransferase family protein [Flavobacteriaceae bacterium]